MPNILPPADAETVSFSPPVVDNESAEPPRDRESLAGVIGEGRIAELDDVPLAKGAQALGWPMPSALIPNQTKSARTRSSALECLPLGAKRTYRRHGRGVCF